MSTTKTGLVTRRIRYPSRPRNSPRLFRVRFFRLFVQRPSHVLANEFRRMIHTRRKRADNAVAAWRVAEGDGDVAQPALVTDAADCRAFGQLQEFLFAPRE